MKIEITQSELYPFYEIEPAKPNASRAVEVPDEIVARWKAAAAEFESVQREMESIASEQSIGMGLSEWRPSEWRKGRMTFQHARTGQRIEMPDRNTTPPEEWKAEWERRTKVNGPGNGEEGRQA